MTQPLQNNFTAGNPNFRDISKPVYQPYVKREFPKMLYHPTEKTQASKMAREKALTYNKLHPDTPGIVPDLIPVWAEVADAKEQKALEAKGYSTKAPHPYDEE